MVGFHVGCDGSEGEDLRSQSSTLGQARLASPRLTTIHSGGWIDGNDGRTGRMVDDRQTEAMVGWQAAVGPAWTKRVGLYAVSEVRASARRRSGQSRAERGQVSHHPHSQQLGAGSAPSPSSFRHYPRDWVVVTSTTRLSSRWGHGTATCRCYAHPLSPTLATHCLRSHLNTSHSPLHSAC